MDDCILQILKPRPPVGVLLVPDLGPREKALAFERAAAAPCYLRASCRSAGPTVVAVLASELHECLPIGRGKRQRVRHRGEE